MESRKDGKVDDEPFTEETIRFVLAEDESEARRKAEDFCRASEHSFRNEDGETVSWHFLKVEHVREFVGDEIVDGVEVYSRFNRGPNDE